MALLPSLVLIAHAETKYRPRFNVPEVPDPQSEQKQQQAEKDKKDKKAAAMIDLERQQKILDQYKPLIQRRSYDELIDVREPAPALRLNRLPQLSEAIIPGRYPNIRLTPYLLTSFAHPAYKAIYEGVEYYIAVNCDDPRSFDDCSTTPHNLFKDKKVYVRFIQSNDVNFNRVEGMRIGNRFDQVSHLFEEDASIHGDGECLKSKNDWLVCFDANNLSVNKRRLQMMPIANARLLRFLKVSGRGY